MEGCGGCFLAGVIDVAGLETGWAEVMYAACEGSSGDCLSKDEMLVMLLAAIESEIEEA